jgi:hypothetical protein
MAVGMPSRSGGAIPHQNDETTDSLCAGAVGIAAAFEGTAPSSRTKKKTVNTGYEMTNTRTNKS